MQRRITQLEDQLSTTTRTISQPPVSLPNLDIETTISSIGGVCHIQHERHSVGPAEASVTRTTMHKSRWFGQSHWINGVAVVSTNDPMIQ